MKPQEAASVMQYIDDDLIAEAIEYKRRVPSTRLLKICACIMIMAIIVAIGCFHFEGNNDRFSPFILSAYAISGDEASTVTESRLEKGAKIPISAFETERGILVFVFSYDKKDKNRFSSVNVILTADYAEDIGEIMKFPRDVSKNYYVYVPREADPMPYELTLFVTNPDTGVSYRYEISIIQADGSCYAELTDVKVAEPTDKETLFSKENSPE